MKQAKRMLAVLLAMAMLCGFMAIGAFAAEKTTAAATEEQVKELKSYMKIVLPIAVLEAGLGRVPNFLKWTAFSKGSSFEAMEDELKAELKKANLDYDDFLKWIKDGTAGEHVDEVLLGNKIFAEKAPAIVKKHCAFYIDWAMDILVWVNGRSIVRILPA